MSKHSASGSAWERQKVRVWERDGWVCAYCANWLERGHHDPQHESTVDHIEPIALNPGRVYEDSELVSACRSCNAAKGDRVAVRVNWRNPRWLPNGLPA